MNPNIPIPVPPPLSSGHVPPPPGIECKAAPGPPGAQIGSPTNPTGSSPALIGLILLGIVLLFCAWAIVGVTGYFRLGSETSGLRSAALASLPGTINKRVAVSVGWFSTALVRFGSRFFTMPPEPRAALDSVRGASVGVYQLEQDPTSSSVRQLIISADAKMKGFGWDRVVGVTKEHELVAVYFPHRHVSASNLRCCVLVLQNRDLVIVSAAGNLEPLLELAHKHVDMGEVRRHLAFATGEQTGL